MPHRPGDFNGDGAVDALDLAVWQDAFGAGGEVPTGLELSEEQPTGFAHGGEEFLAWQARLILGRYASPTSPAPEPGAIALITQILARLCLGRRKRAAR